MFGIEPPSKDVFNPETLKIVEELTARGWEMQGSLRVDSLANFQHTQSVGEDDLLVDYLIPEDTELTFENLTKIKSIALNEKSLVNSIVSSSGHVTAVFLAVRNLTV